MNTFKYPEFIWPNQIECQHIYIHETVYNMESNINSRTKNICQKMCLVSKNNATDSKCKWKLLNIQIGKRQIASRPNDDKNEKILFVPPFRKLFRWYCLYIRIKFRWCQVNRWINSWIMNNDAHIWSQHDILYRILL